MKVLFGANRYRLPCHHHPFWRFDRYINDRLGILAALAGICTAIPVYIAFRGCLLDKFASSRLPTVPTMHVECLSRSESLALRTYHAAVCFTLSLGAELGSFRAAPRSLHFSRHQCAQFPNMPAMPASYTWCQ